ncbi:MAG: ABC transporter substrate-binding protein [Firmicutes bacterium]|nr:ABC transporter substrate-binding protein [Bacillota bacterium]
MTKGMRTRSMGRVLAAAAVSLLLAAATGCSRSQPPGQPTGASGPSPGPSAGEGQVLRFTIDYTKDREAEVQAIVADLRKIGIEVSARLWEKQTLLDAAKTGEREAYTTDWGSSTFSPYDLAIPKLKTGDRGNFSHYSNPEVDRLFEVGSFGATEEERRQAYFKVQEILKEDAPWIFGYFRMTVEAASARVKGYRPALDSRMNLHDVSLEGGDTLVVGLLTNALQSLDPANHRDRETETVIRNIYDGLVTRTPDGKVVPELAESWQTDDNKVWTFTLRQGVRFHDGTPMTAEDVVFTFERTLSPTGIDGQPSPRAGLLGPLEKVEKVDERTVRFTLSQPFPEFLQLLPHHQIVSKAYVEKVGSAGLSERPNGTGPFKFVSGRLDGEVILERFDDYYGGAPDLPPVGPPPLRRVVFRMMPDPASRVSALKAGDVHIIQAVPVDAVPDLEQDPAIQVLTAEGTRLYMIELNNKVFTDRRVRQALNYAINWDAILSAVYGGTAQRVPTAMLPSGFGYNPDVQPYPYDPDKARELLREAGYQVR